MASKTNIILTGLVVVFVGLASVLGFYLWQTSNTLNTANEKSSTYQTEIASLKVQVATLDSQVRELELGSNATVGISTQLASMSDLVATLESNTNLTSVGIQLTALRAELGNVQTILPSCLGSDPVEFQSIPVDFGHMPVFLMRPNSTATVCVTYRAGWADNASSFVLWPSSFTSATLNFFTEISKETCTVTNDSVTCTSMASHSFRVVATPSGITPSAYVGYVTVAYSVIVLPNATGFYDHSFVIACESPRIAVGYSAAQVNSSDFAAVPIHSCFNSPYQQISTVIRGMSVSYLAIRAISR